MDIKNTIISAEVVIESLITLLKNEGVDISSIQFSIGNKEKGTESADMSFESLIHLTLSWLNEAKNQAVPEGFILVKKTNRIGNPSVDFSQAPRWAKYWLKDGHSKKYWWSSVRPKKDMDLECYVWGGQHYVEEAPAFGFLGTWDKSLTSKRAMFEAQESANDSR